MRDGGSALVRVTDDGHGMDRDDARIAVLRHATSKIRSAADLARILTLGFRGEALPSIAAVARMRLVTRTRDSVEATEVVLEGGGPAKIGPAGAPVGTTIEVRDLFFNTPARKKFLKSAGTESAQISEICLRAALYRPGPPAPARARRQRAREFLPSDDLGRARAPRARVQGRAHRQHAACGSGARAVECARSAPQRRERAARVRQRPPGGATTQRLAASRSHTGA